MYYLQWAIVLVSLSLNFHWGNTADESEAQNRCLPADQLPGYSDYDSGFPACCQGITTLDPRSL